MFSRNLLLSLSLSMIAGMSLTSICSCPAYSQSSVSVTASQISQSKSALAGAKNALSDFDSKLEFPLSDPEKQESQKALNDYQKDFSIENPREISGESVLKLAQKTLETARSAGEEAEDGDRTKAVSRFTEARKLLYKTKKHLSALENQSLASAPEKKLLTARAQKEDQLLNAGKAKAETQKVTTYSQSNSGADITTVNISPAGIHVKESTGNRVQNTDVNISPGSISVRDHGTGPGPMTNRSTVQISPAGIHVRDRGTASNSTVSINTGVGSAPGNLNLGNLGQSISNLVSGTVNSALNTAQVATSTALGAAGTATGARSSININTNATTRIPNQGNAITITGHDNNRTLRLNGQDLTITGHTNRITVIGHAGIVTVTGHDNIVNLEGVNTITTNGHDNAVYWKFGPNGANPGVNMLGRQNTISRIH